MANRAHPLRTTVAVIAMALPIAVPVFAEDAPSQPKSEHHGMSMDGQSGMMGHMQGDTKSGTAKDKSDSMSEGCRQMMDAMSKTAPDSGTTAPKNDRHGC